MRQLGDFGWRLDHSDMLDFRRHIGQLNVVKRGDNLQNIGKW